MPDSEVQGARITHWMQLDLLAALQQWAEQQDQSLRRSAEKVTTASLHSAQDGWYWHSVLGFKRQH